MSTHNIGFYEEISKIITLLSSNKHLISSADVHTNYIWSYRCLLQNFGEKCDWQYIYDKWLILAEKIKSKYFLL